MTVSERLGTWWRYAKFMLPGVAGIFAVLAGLLYCEVHFAVLNHLELSEWSL